ncbi:MAG TPA: hypothetical protein VGK03_13635 [Geothrix sp.]
MSASAHPFDGVQADSRGPNSAGAPRPAHGLNAAGWCLAAALLLLPFGCGGGGSASSSGGTTTPPVSATPTITTFSATQVAVAAGASTQITAVFANGTGTVSPGVGAVTSGVAVTVTPLVTTTYTLTVTDASAHTVSQPLIVGVKKPPFELVSLGSTGVPADWQSYLRWQTISADGRYVAFASMDNTLVAGDTNGIIDIFVRDRQTATTICASRAADGTAANGYSDKPEISADGRYVVFESHATNLVAGGDPARSYADIYRYDLQTRQTIRVSVDNAGLVGRGSSFTPRISADGRYVVFACDAQLTTEFPTSTSVYLRDTVSSTTTLVSRKANGAWASGTNPAISADGTKVIYESLADNLSLGATAWQIYAFNRATATTSLVSASATGTPREQGNESSSRAIQSSLSRDGRYVTFCTTASNLVPGVTGGIQNVFVKDTQDGAIALLSQNATGAFGNADSVRSQGGRAMISADGTWVTFNTSATNLIGGQSSTMAVNIFTGVTEVLQPGGGFVGDTDPCISPDAFGRFVVIVAGEQLDPRYAFRGMFLKDRHVAPMAVAGPGQTVNVGASVTLDGSGSQLSPNPSFPVAALSYAWSQLSGPAAVSLSSSTVAKPTFTAPAAGTYVFKLVVNDTIEDSLPVLMIVKVQ